MSVRSSRNPARFPAHKFGDVGGTLVTWQNAEDGSAEQAWKQTLPPQTDNLRRRKRQPVPLATLQDVDAPRCLLSPLKEACLYSVYDGAQRTGPRFTCARSRSSSDRVGAQGASYPSLLDPDTLNKEQCCGEDFRPIDSDGVQVVGRSLEAVYFRVLPSGI